MSLKMMSPNWLLGQQGLFPLEGGKQDELGLSNTPSFKMDLREFYPSIKRNDILIHATM